MHLFFLFSIYLFAALENELEGYESQLKELKKYSHKLMPNTMKKLHEVLEKARKFFMTDAPRLAVSELTTGGTNDTSLNLPSLHLVVHLPL